MIRTQQHANNAGDMSAYSADPALTKSEVITLRTPRSANPNDTRLAVLLAKVDAVLRFANNPLGTFGELRAARAAFDEVPGGETDERPTIIPE